MGQLARISIFAAGIAVQLSATVALADAWPPDRLVSPPVAAELPADVVSAPAETLLEPSAPRLMPQTPDAAFRDVPDQPFGQLPLCRLSFGPYGWLPEMYGQVGIRNLTSDIGVSTRDMLNLIEHNAHFVFAAQMEVEYGQWSVSSSGLYIYAGFGRDIGRLSFSGNGSFAVVDAALGYDTGLASTLGLPAGSEIELLAGTRYWLIGGNVTLTGSLGNTATRGSDVDWVDPVFGGRLTWAVRPDLRLRVRGDIGGFGWWTASEETWNLEATLEKKCTAHCTIAAGYRILDVDYQRGGANRFSFDAQMRGPVANLSLDF